MATQQPEFAISVAEFAAALLAEAEVTPRARLLARQAAEGLPSCAVVVYVVEDQDSPEWIPKAVLGEVALHEAAVAFDAGTLGTLADAKETLLLAGSDVPREAYAHLDVRRSVQTLAYLPLIAEGRLVGALELVSFEQPLSEASLAPLFPLAEYAAVALAAALDYESERNEKLASISRLAQLYDVEKAFHSILEMDELMPVITAKVQEILGAQAANLWMVDGEGGLLLTSRSGVDPTVEEQARLEEGEGIPGAVAETSEAVLIESAADERLQQRNADIQEGAIFSLMAVPVVAKDHLVGVLEVANKLDGIPFDEDDLFLLNNIAEAAGSSLNNANLLQTERKLEILETLVEVSRHITSTLDLERVTQAIVNGPAAVVGYERAALALETQGRLELKAVSGMDEIRATDPDVVRLKEILEWASLSGGELFVAQRGEDVASDREETRAKFQRYFGETGMRAFYAVPLADDQGKIGVLCFESSQPDFLTEAHIEMLKVLAGQATVALRNASLYREVPFIGVLEPLLRKKERFLAMEKRRRRAMVGLAVAVVVFLAFFPLPMRVGGRATVTPLHTVQVQPETAGVIARVLVREGDPVRKGTILAEMEDWQYRTELASAQARHEAALAEMNRALAARDSREAGIQRIQADYWHSETELARQRLERTRLRAPIDGVVATPRIETFAGRHLQPGDPFAEIIDSSRAVVDVIVDEEEVGLLRAGDTAAIKLQGYPTQIFRGKVAVVSPRSHAEGDERHFFARVEVPNDEGYLLAGMQGEGKISTGWKPAGYVLFRRPAIWFWAKLWQWFGW